MKKVYLLLFIIVLLLSGCSQLQPYIEKIPFLGESDSNAVERNDPQDATDTTDNNELDQDTQNQEESTDSDIVEEDVLTLESQYFNEVVQVDGKNIIQNPLNVLALVNKEFSLPSDYAPKDLVRPNVPFSFGDMGVEKSFVRKEAAGALERLFALAKKDGIELFAVSGYRSFERQAMLYDAEVKKSGEEAAQQVVAIPGNSEHQSGLAMDISSRSVGLALTEEFGETVEGKWLAANAHKFGYVLRYPKGKESITGYQYEPWHFRYIGVEAAQIIYEKGMTLEEYFSIVKKI
ncbi:D-alanyl-D-alanine carboxypeptidase family protein [Cytobacillus sp. FJAT-54145]|uniref:D-alanyl-D-alanine carboxypeptidase family protein n=1 Tax=Cytobacillus spartinae TaxID=3299023 RepID=A0ABW6KD28_9BACI